MIPSTIKEKYPCTRWELLHRVYMCSCREFANKLSDNEYIDECNVYVDIGDGKWMGDYNTFHFSIVTTNNEWEQTRYSVASTMLKKNMLDAPLDLVAEGMERYLKENILESKYESSCDRMYSDI